jgi:hypothetical protein
MVRAGRRTYRAADLLHAPDGKAGLIEQPIGTKEQDVRSNMLHEAPNSLTTLNLVRLRGNSNNQKRPNCHENDHPSRRAPRAISDRP